MPLKALRLKPGIFRENTRYSAEGGWYECDKVRFRSGQPEKIGGWQQVNNDQFLGFARALWPWDVYLGLGMIRLLVRLLKLLPLPSTTITKYTYKLNLVDI